VPALEIIMPIVSLSTWSLLFHGDCLNAMRFAAAQGFGGVEIWSQRPGPAPVGRVQFTFALPILASGRRLVGEGVVTTGIRYAVKYLWVTAFGRPFTRASRDIRPVH
jgi:hypothetical protein